MVMVPDMSPDFEIYTGTLAALSGLIIGLIIILFVRQLYLKENQKASAGQSINEEAT